MIDPVAQVLDDCIIAIEKNELTLSECLEKYPEYEAELLPILEVVDTLRNAPEVVPTRTFLVNSRQNILDAISVRELKTNHRPKQSIINFRLKGHFQSAYVFATIIIILVVGLIAGTGTVYASYQSLPGDALYSVKLKIEDIQLGLTANQEQRANLELQFANERIQEINELMGLGRYKEMAAAIEDLENILNRVESNIASVEAKDHEAGDRLKIEYKAQQARNTEVLIRVLDDAPEQAKPALEHALEVSRKSLPDAQPLDDSITNETPGNEATEMMPAEESGLKNTQNPKINNGDSGRPADNPTKPTTMPGKPTEKLNGKPTSSPPTMSTEVPNGKEDTNPGVQSSGKEPDRPSVGADNQPTRKPQH